MLVACWSAKGGSGTTVAAASLALMVARDNPHGAVIADLAGDVPAVLGQPDPATTGLAGWLRGGDTTDAAEALTQLKIDVAPGLALLPRGAGPLASDDTTTRSLTALFDHSQRPVIVDCGTLTREPDVDVAAAVAHRAGRSLLVIRPCYLSIRKATNAPVRPTGAIAVLQDGYPLGRSDVERTLECPVVGRIPIDPAVAHAVDAGLASGTLPRALKRGLRDAL